MYRGVLRHPCFVIARAAGDFRQRKGKKPPARCLCTESAGGRPTRAREGARCRRGKCVHCLPHRGAPAPPSFAKMAAAAA